MHEGTFTLFMKPDAETLPRWEADRYMVPVGHGWFRNRTGDQGSLERIEALAKSLTLTYGPMGFKYKVMRVG